MTLRLTPYLELDGQTKEAIQFYEKALGAQLLFMSTFGDMPANPEFPLPEEAKDRVAHAMLKVGDSEMMFSDIFPGGQVQPGSQVTICINTQDVEQARTMYDALQQDGTAIIPLGEAFFSPAYGKVKDKYGIVFHVFTEAKPVD